MNGVLQARKNADDINALANALRVACTLLSLVDNKRLDELEHTMRMADNLAMLLVPPIDFAKSVKNVDLQKSLIRWARQTRSTLREFVQAAEDGNDLFKGWQENGDTPSIDWLLGEGHANEEGDISDD